MRQRLAAALASALLLAACGEGEEKDATMMPGSNCMSCHDGRGEAPVFTAAGTVYPYGNAPEGAGLAGVTVTLAGNGRAVTLVTNSAGNFFTSASLGATLSVAVSGNGGSTDRGLHHGGACASCHHAGSASAPARVHVGACATCH